MRRSGTLPGLLRARRTGTDAGQSRGDGSIPEAERSPALDRARPGNLSSSQESSGLHSIVPDLLTNDGCPTSRSFFARCGIPLPLSLGLSIHPRHLTVNLGGIPYLAKNERDMGHPSFVREPDTDSAETQFGTDGSHAPFDFVPCSFGEVF